MYVLGNLIGALEFAFSADGLYDEVKTAFT